MKGNLPKLHFSVSCLEHQRLFHRKCNAEKILKFIQAVEHPEGMVRSVKHMKY